MIEGLHNCIMQVQIFSEPRDTVIKKNDRICQFRIIEKMHPVIITEVEHMTDDPRGGFGSTGVK